MKVQIVHARVKPEYVAEIEAANKGLFAAIDREQPQGVRYASCLHPDGVTHVIFLQLDEGVDYPLEAIPEVRAIQESLKNWYAEPPKIEQLTVVGSYRLF